MGQAKTDYLIKILPPDHKLITEFREEIYTNDLKINKSFLKSHLTHNQCRQKFPSDNWEEIYKFSDLKWENSAFDGVAVAIGADQRVHSLAGFKKYEPFMRVGMHLYTLKNYRSSCRSMLWKDGGFIDISLKSYTRRTGSFITIYPHNKALSQWAKRLSNKNNFGQMATENRSITNKMSLFKPIQKKILFNNVYQNVFFNFHSSEGNELEAKDLLIKVITRPVQ